MKKNAFVGRNEIGPSAFVFSLLMCCVARLHLQPLRGQLLYVLHSKVQRRIFLHYSFSVSGVASTHQIRALPLTLDKSRVINTNRHHDCGDTGPFSLQDLHMLQQRAGGRGSEPVLQCRAGPRVAVLLLPLQPQVSLLLLVCPCPSSS